MSPVPHPAPAEPPFPVRLLRFSAQVFLLWGIYAAANLFVETFALPVPGNVLGVILLFALLAAGIVKLHHVQDAADFLLKHLVLFFVPFTVSLMDWGPTLYSYGFVLAIALVVSAVLPFWTVGYLVLLFHGGKESCDS